MDEFDGLKKGDTVFLVYDPIHSPGKHRGSEVTVKSVGPKWITVGGGSKFERESGAGEFGWVIYRSREVYERRKALALAWKDLQQMFGGFRRPAAVVSVEQVELARAILTQEVNWRHVVAIDPADAACLNGVVAWQNGKREIVETQEAADRVDRALRAHAKTGGA